MQTVSASELARSTSAVLERIHLGETVKVVRNRAEIAHIVPARRTMTAAQAIAGLGGRMTRQQGKAWLKDSRGDFNNEVRNPWE